MPSVRETTRMRKVSGSVETDDRLAAFLYVLVRDALPLGEIERLVDLVSDRDAGAPVLWKLTNGWLAEWTIDAAERLRPPSAAELEARRTSSLGVCPECQEVAHDADCPLVGDGRPVEDVPGSRARVAEAAAGLAERY